MSEKRTRASWGAQSHRDEVGQLPSTFPRTMGPSAMAYLQEVVDSGLTVDMVGRFERAFAELHGVKHCIGTPGCTPALAALAAAFDFEPGDEIIVSPITDYGTLQGLVAQDYIPVFADTEPGTVNMSAETIEPLISDRTRAILCVHKTGIPCDMDPILQLAEEHDLFVYEDACQAVLGEYKGRLCGTLADAAGFSFDAEKTMGADMGGCILTDDDDLAERVRFIGQSRGAEMKPGFGRLHVELGYAYRMPQCTAATCLAQLEIIEEQVATIDRAVRLMTELMDEIPGITPLPIPDYCTVYSSWMFGLSIDPEQFTCTADEFGAQLAEEGIPGAGTARYYLMPEACTFLQRWAEEKTWPYSMPPASREYSYGEQTCPTAHDFLDTWIRWSTICEKYTEDDCYLAARIVRDVAERNRR